MLCNAFFIFSYWKIEKNTGKYTRKYWNELLKFWWPPSLIVWIVSYEFLPSISVISLDRVHFFFTSDYLDSCFCRLIYWEATTDLEGNYHWLGNYHWPFYIFSTKLLCFIFSSEALSFTFLIIPPHIFPSKYFPFLSFLSFWYFY